MDYKFVKKFSLHFVIDLNLKFKSEIKYIKVFVHYFLCKLVYNSFTNGMSIHWKVLSIVGFI